MLYREYMVFDGVSDADGATGWTEDCNKKMDYDPTIVRLCSRAYRDGDYGSSVCIGSDEVYRTGIVSAGTQEAAMAAIEAWSEAEAKRIAEAVRALYPKA